MKSIILNNKKIYFFDNIDFEVNGSRFRIIATASTGPGAHDATHTVRNLGNGKVDDLSMESLISIFKKNHLI